MTIAAVYLTKEGVVLGADSTTTYTRPTAQGQEVVLQLCNHAQKIFEVGKPEKGTLAVSTWGMGEFIDKSIRHLVAEFSDAIDDGRCRDFDAALQRLLDLATPAYNRSIPAGRSAVFGLALGGYVLPDRTPRAVIIRYRSQEHAPIVEEAERGRPYFFGCPDIFDRIFWGYDSRLKQRIVERYGEAVFREMTSDLPLRGVRELPVREAANYVYFLCYATTQAYRYKYGAPVCGGAIEVALITADRRFRWIHHKRMDSAIDFP